MATRLLLLFVIVLAGWLALQRPRGRGPVAREWRDVLFVRVTAFVIGTVVAAAAAEELELGRGAMLAPAIIGLAVVVGVASGEAIVRPPRPVGLRRASLRPRQVRDYLTTRLTTVAMVTIAVHVITLITTTITASADDMGRVGRVVAHQCAATAESRGPYPGSFYSLPLTGVLVLIAAIAAVALVVVVRRPRGFAPDEAGEDGLRRRSVTTILSAVGAAVAASHAGIALYAGIALVGMNSCAAAWMRPVGILLLVTLPLAVVALAWFLGRVIVPEPTR